MRLPRVRFTVRGMAGVAILAMLLGGFFSGMRWWREASLRDSAEYYRRRAAEHAEIERDYPMRAYISEMNQRMRIRDRSKPFDPVSWEQRGARYHAALKLKYLRAASRPWEVVPADSPSPP